jgi:hypothetical protein
MNVGQKGFVKIIHMRIIIVLPILNAKMMIFTGISSIVIVRRCVAADTPDLRLISLVPQIEL